MNVSFVALKWYEYGVNTQNTENKNRLKPKYE